MRKILSTLLLLLFVIGTSLAQDNELHAFELKHEGVIPIKDYADNAVFTEYNISDNDAPQNEPSVRISRSNPNIVVAAWRDFREGWQEPNVIRRIGYSYSHDGGHTWATSQLLPDPLPNHLSQSDPVLTSDSEGNFYISSTSRQPVTNYNRDMLIYKSTDDGVTFSLHATAVPGSGQQGEDKEWIFCDPVPTNPTYDQVMIVWRSFGPVPKIKFRKSDLGGTYWGQSVEVSDGYWGQGANMATGTNGNIYVVWWDGGLMFDRSMDGGESFGTDSYISNYGYQINTTFPYICVDYSDKASRGNVYTVWADAREGTDDIWFQRSTDHGDSWLSAPIMVNDVEINQQYWPMIECDENGRIVIIYFDEREGPTYMNAYLAYSDDEGNTWTNTLLSNETFSGATPNSNVRFGDYIGIDAYDGKIVPVWTDDRDGNYNQEIYTALVDIPQAVGEYSLANDAFTLHQNFPNPFSAQTSIYVELHENMQLKAEVYNISGQIVDIPLDAFMEKGDHQIEWNAENLRPGIYFLKMYSGKAVARLKMTIR